MNDGKKIVIVLISIATTFVIGAFDGDMSIFQYFAAYILAFIYAEKVI